MNITTTQLKEMILEETLAVLNEKKKPKQSSAGNAWHNDDGTWGSNKSAKSFSHSGKQLAWPAGSDSSVCGRGSRYKCKDRSDLKYEDQSDVLLTAPGDETDRDRRSRLYPGHSELKKLSLGIFEDIESKLIEREEDLIQFTPNQLKQYRASLWKQFIGGIEQYERASNPKS